MKDTPACPNPHSTAPFTFSGHGGVADVGQADYCYPEDLEDIKKYNYVTPALLAIYLLIGNVMLLNLLIAIFTSVGQKHARTDISRNLNSIYSSFPLLNPNQSGPCSRRSTRTRRRCGSGRCTGW